MPGPISPDDVSQAQADQIPEPVFEVFNALIAKHWNGHSAVVLLDDAVKELVDRGFTRARLFDEHLLDVEGAYRLNGWEVNYDQPGYNETGNRFYTFRKPSKR